MIAQVIHRAREDRRRAARNPGTPWSREHDLLARIRGHRRRLERCAREWVVVAGRAGRQQSRLALTGGWDHFGSKVVAFRHHGVTVPIMLLARLAVDTTWQGKGLGLALVVDAMRRVLQVADIAGVRAMAVHAKDDNAQRFYEHLGFEAFPDQPLTLYRLLKDIRGMQSGNR